MAITHAEFDKLKTENATLRTEREALAAQLKDSNEELERLRGNLQLQATRAANAEERVKSLRDELASVSRTAGVAGEPARATAEMPRRLYRGDSAEGASERFPNLAAAKEAMAAEPGVWFNDASEARDHYFKGATTELADVEPADV